MPPPDRFPSRVQWSMRALISLGVLLVCFAMVLSDGYSENWRTWAAGLIGVVLGYWLR